MARPFKVGRPVGSKPHPGVAVGVHVTALTVPQLREGPAMHTHPGGNREKAATNVVRVKPCKFGEVFRFHISFYGNNHT